MQPVSCATMRYIKLGDSGRWADISLDRGELHFGHGRVPHEIALSGDRDAIKRYLFEKGTGKRAIEDAREVSDFYNLGADCLWITFARGCLWWTFAAPEVMWLGLSADKAHGERMRKCIDGWKNTDVNGKELKTVNLSTKLTRLAAYQRTICAVEQGEYLLRRINGMEEPIVAEANKAREALIDVTAKAIATLHWADFETLVDIIFARSGWYRASAIGGTQATIDLALEQPTTGEQAAVQVKSKATQAVLDRFLDEIDKSGSYHRVFFVCHSPKGTLTVPEGRDNVHIWSGRDLAATVAKVGLHDWVFEKVA
jgi:hypothetical protein